MYDGYPMNHSAIQSSIIHPLPNSISKILAEYRAALVETLGEDLDSVILYGSYARGEARGADSDIDIMCVMRGAFDYGSVMERTSEPAARLSLEHDVVLSTVFAARKDVDGSRLPFFMNVRKEGLFI